MADIIFFYVKLTLGCLCLVCAKPESKKDDDKQYYNPDYGERCANPPKVENGRVAKVENLRRARVAWFKCNDGFQIGPADVRVCQQGRMWSNKGSITCTKIKVEVQQKLKNLATDVRDVEGTLTGKLITAGIFVVVIIILLVMVHIGRVVATRKSMKTKYDDVIKSGERPRQEVPSAFTVSNDLLKSSLCCQQSKLPKKFTPKREKKKKKKSKDKDPDDINMNRTVENNKHGGKKSHLYSRVAHSSHTKRPYKGQYYPLVF